MATRQDALKAAKRDMQAQWAGLPFREQIRARMALLDDGQRVVIARMVSTYFNGDLKRHRGTEARLVSLSDFHLAFMDLLYPSATIRSSRRRRSNSRTTTPTATSSRCASSPPTSRASPCQPRRLTPGRSPSRVSSRALSWSATWTAGSRRAPSSPGRRRLRRIKRSSSSRGRLRTMAGLSGITVYTGPISAGATSRS